MTLSNALRMKLQINWSIVRQCTALMFAACKIPCSVDTNSKLFNTTGNHLHISLFLLYVEPKSRKRLWILVWDLQEFSYRGCDSILDQNKASALSHYNHDQWLRIALYISAGCNGTSLQKNNSKLELHVSLQMLEDRYHSCHLYCLSLINGNRVTDNFWS